MQIEAGKYYRTRDGRKAGPMSVWDDYFCGFIGKEDRLWWPDGRHGSRANPNIPHYDLIAEWSDTPPIDLTAITTPFGLLDADTQAALKAHGGPYEVFGGEWRYISRIYDGDDGHAYRVKPTPPKPQTRTAWAVGHHLRYTEAEADDFLAQLRLENPGMFDDYRVIKMIEVTE